MHLQENKLFHIILYEIKKKKITTIIATFCLMSIVSACSNQTEQIILQPSEIVPTTPKEATLTLKPTATLITEDEPAYEKVNSPHNTATPIPVPTLPSILLPPEEVYRREEVYPAHAYLYQTPEGIQLILFDGWGKTIQKITFENDGPSPFHLGTFQPPCKLNLVATTGQEIYLVRYDLSSGHSEELFKGQKQPDDSWQTWPKISPNGEWITYTIWSGERYYDSAEFHDVELVRRTGGQPLRITTRGGASSSGGVWSPVENIIAFGDTDERENQQLYIYDPNDAKKETLTNFSDPEIRIGLPSWSSQGNRIAFVVGWSYEMEHQPSELWVTDLQTRQTTRMALPDSVEQISSDVYWSEDEELMMVFTNNATGNYGIYWVNNQKNRIQYAFDGDQADRLYYLEMPVPITKDLRAVGSFDRGIIYDAVRNEILELKDTQYPVDGLPIDSMTIPYELGECFLDYP